MAYVKENIFMNGVSGTIDGQMTLRVRKGKTVISVKRGADTVPPTEQRLIAREVFEDASAYAKHAIADPKVKMLYAAAAKRGQSAYNAAFQDAAKVPKIILVNTDRYKGSIDDIITIAVKDVIRVGSVRITILAATGEQLEQGDALPGEGVSYWEYTATAANPVLPGTHIIVTATDLPGNTAQQTLVL